MPGTRRDPSSPTSPWAPPEPDEPQLVIGDAPEELTPENMYTFLILSEIQQHEEEKADDEKYGPETPEERRRYDRWRNWIIPSPLLWAMIFLAMALGFIGVRALMDDSPSGQDAVPGADQDDLGGANDQNPTATTTAPGLPKLLSGPWVAQDGGIGYEFAADGTYTWASLDDQGTGRYRFETEGDTEWLLFVDPSDPSGLTILGQVEVRFDGDTMVLAHPDSETTFAHGDLPVPGSGPEPRVTFDAAAASSLNGMLRILIPAQLSPKGYPLSDEAAPLSATGSITMDAATNEVSGEVRAHYGCRPEQCSGDGTDPSADLVITVTGSGPSTFQQMTWAFEGTATVQIEWSDGEMLAGELVPWTLSRTYDVTYTAGLERAGYAVFDIVFYLPPTDPAAEPDIGLQFQVIWPATR